MSSHEASLRQQLLAARADVARHLEVIGGPRLYVGVPVSAAKALEATLREIDEALASLPPDGA